ncbi:MAG: hypothetical protein GY749_24850 [Desulfobacteraceae bacterium]|nr:hypothetical protein [Desulfobacteraceae bacterium]
MPCLYSVPFMLRCDRPVMTVYMKVPETGFFKKTRFLLLSCLVCDCTVMAVYMKEEFKACFVSNTHKASFELLFNASIVTVGSWLFI